jgi:hypothetical protein
MKLILSRMVVAGAALLAFAVCERATALEAVVQSDVGSGSAVAGSIGAVNSRADALQGNMNAANLIIQQLQQQIATLQKQVSSTEKILNQITVYGNGSNGSNGGSGSSGSAGKTLEGVGGLSGYNGTDAVQPLSSGGSMCGLVRWKVGTNYAYTTPSTADGSVIVNHQGAYGYYNDIVYQAPCMGEAMVVNEQAHCPTGYAFMVSALDTDSYTPLDPGLGNPPSILSSQEAWGTCIKQ